MSAGGYAVAPIPSEGPLLDEYIKQRWEALPSAQRDLTEWVPTRAIWLPIMQNKRELELVHYFGPYNGRYNMSGCRAYGCGATSTPCSESTATAPSTARRLRHVVRPTLHPRRRRGRHPREAPWKASPPHAPPLILHHRVVLAGSASGRAALGLLQRRRA
jgi:hypothetical protein